MTIYKLTALGGDYAYKYINNELKNKKNT